MADPTNSDPKITLNVMVYSLLVSSLPSSFTAVICQALANIPNNVLIKDGILLATAIIPFALGPKNNRIIILFASFVSHQAKLFGIIGIEYFNKYFVLDIDVFLKLI